LYDWTPALFARFVIVSVKPTKSVGAHKEKNKWEKAKQPSATEKSENFRCQF
jgi:hypothetical protein